MGLIKPSRETFHRIHCKLIQFKYAANDSKRAETEGHKCYTNIHICIVLEIQQDDFSMIWYVCIEVYWFLGILAITEMAAFVFSLLFESPFLGLEKVIFPLLDEWIMTPITQALPFKSRQSRVQSSPLQVLLPRDFILSLLL